jgi:hypothetical protein
MSPVNLIGIIPYEVSSLLKWELDILRSERFRGPEMPMGESNPMQV